MGRTGNKCLLFLALLVFIQFVDANTLVRRKREGDGNWIEKLRDGLRARVPLVGGLLADCIQGMLNIWTKMQELTNGAVGRTLGGAFPCTMSAESLVCSGVTTKSDLHTTMMSLVTPLPLPQFVKNLISVSIQTVPVTMDILWGGMDVSQS